MAEEKLNITKYLTHDFVLNFSLLLSDYYMKFNFKPDPNKPDDISQIEYTPEFTESGHVIRIKEFSIQPAFDIKKVRFTADYPSQDDKFPAEGDKESRMKNAKTHILNAIKALSKSKLKMAAENEDVDETSEESTEETPGKEISREIQSTNEFSIKVDSFKISYSKDVAGLNVIKNKNGYTIYITPEYFVARVSQSTAGKISILFNNQKLQASHETKFLEEVFPTIKVEFLL